MGCQVRARLLVGTFIIISSRRTTSSFYPSSFPPSTTLPLFFPLAPLQDSHPDALFCDSYSMMSGTVTGPENQENTSATGSSSDPASSLRAAALLTLKSKRRKAAGEQSSTAALPARPPPIADSFQLDYGQEDVPSSTTRAPAPGPSKPHPVDMEDGQIREEGEISDSEEQLATAAPARTKQSPLPMKTPQPQLPQLEPAHEIKSSLASPSRTAVTKQESPPVLLERITNISPSPLEIRDSSNMVVDVDESYSSNAYLALGPDHVRPGLHMNQTQYDTAKDIILDLLGWGIPPTYLVDCGLSREIVYYVFNELNLRLPDNLDTNGLIPYLPPPFFRSDATQEPSSSMPPPPVPSGLQYHNLPPRPLKLSDVQSPGPNSALPSSLALSTNSPSASETSPVTSLHDMERQRRQELLARKAVQASRKAKPPPPPSPSSSSIASSRYVSPEQLPQDVEMATETVDDFLKTLESTAEGEAMDVDEIPGLGRSQPVSKPQISRQQSFMVGRVVVPLSSLTAEQSSSSNSSTPTPTPLQKSTSMTSLDGQPVRRRPVAADFVDMDGSSRNGTGLANGRSHPPHNLRRKMGTGFANVSKMRRLVIDLSDSEGEGDDDYVMREAGEYTSTTPTYLPTSLFGAKTSRGPRTRSPATLMEKEMEIARMRQLIADKEQNRVKKLMVRLPTFSS
ncbi:uncharacterized protein EV420DRAFT_1516395 [Desarmillaria tabescens]|uniref:Uncharacterized protein n=1 Tax=Armillaria tabescens TaxID=1929756 RepID=A0AA39NF18_ARMTA|nr:uncharacterized protein EV420DRAFT_1516395 [Desarmillaria tabescens]KAK0464439.1 hypothetical protein EV420DRAFT_1516395 [Desarmillaria tabescens]